MPAGTFKPVNVAVSVCVVPCWGSGVTVGGDNFNAGAGFVGAKPQDPLAEDIR